ncbi:MAG: peptidoglycan-binding ATPase [Candidatus Angelobacter sp.]|jgi:general secretion pathway protein A|nr:peptidoglycan-binding ATPase [Candidatus Angelobacter sp.]
MAKQQYFMFLDFYGLREQPFGVTPNPRFLYPSPSHREVLASLLYGIQSDLGFSALIAEPGMGKTTLLFDLLERYRNSANTVFLFHTQCNSQDLLRYCLAELEIETGSDDSFAMHEKFKQVLLQSARDGKKVLMVLDEAHNFDDSVLETIRLLSNFETSDAKLLHIILAGQTHLAEKLMRPAMKQLFQRISIVNRLKPFTFEETRAYIDHRLDVAGYNRGPLFTPDALLKISRYSQGVPRTINRLCFGSMSIACALHQRSIDGDIVEEVREDLNLKSFLPSDATEEMPLGSAQPAVAPRPTTVVARFAERIPAAADRQFASAARQATSAQASESEEKPAPLKPTESPTESDPTLDRVRAAVASQRPPGKAALRAAQGRQGWMHSSAMRFAVTSVAALVFVLLLGLLLYRHAPELEKIFAKVPDKKVADNPAVTATTATPDQAPAPAEPPKPAKRKSRVNPSAVVSRLDGSNAGITLPSIAVANSPDILPNVTLAQPISKQVPPAPVQAQPQSQPSTQSQNQEPATEPPPVNTADAGKDPTSAAAVIGDVLSYTPNATVAASPAAKVSEIVPGKLTQRVPPVYPEEAKRLGIEGIVYLNAVIGKDGNVKQVRATEGETRLASAAEAAVRKWKYTPYMLNGDPVEVETEITVNFKLSSK